MIVNFSIQNFGSVRDKQTLSFEAAKSHDLEDYYVVEPIKGLRLLKLSLIYGANASGKTTILKALQFIRDLILKPLDKKTSVLEYQPFLFDRNSHALNSIISIEFVQNHIRYFYEIEFNKSAIIKEDLYNYNPSKAKIFSRTTNLESQFTEITFGSKIKKDKVFEKSLEANTLWNNSVLGGYLKTNINLPELKEVSDWFSNYLRNIITPETDLISYITSEINDAVINKHTVIEILRQADFNISDIIIKEEETNFSFHWSNGVYRILLNEPADELEERRGNSRITSLNLELEHTIDDVKYGLPFQMESQGTQRYYGLAGLLSMLITKSVAFSIDELESSIHPDLFNHFILSFLVNAKHSQIIATTHNREILNNRDIFRDDAIWFTNKNESCSTELYSLSDFDSNVVRNTSNVYNAYKAGKLGGIPNLGSYYIDTDGEKK